MNIKIEELSLCRKLNSLFLYSEPSKSFGFFFLETPICIVDLLSTFHLIEYVFELEL